MNKILLIISLVFISINAFSQTDVNNNQSGIWALENSPYNVIGDITVPAGTTLTIEAGVEVNFQGYYKLTVLGTLSANGTETDSIFFTTENQSTGWAGISLGTSIGGSVTPADGVSNFSYCRFEYGKTTYEENDPDDLDSNGGAVRMINSDAVYNNCIFSNNSSYEGEGMGGAIYGLNTGNEDNPVTLFTNCKFIDNVGYSEGGAIKFTSDFNTEITNCEFIDNTTSYGGGAICFYSVVDTKVINCLFVNNRTNYDNGGAIKSLGVANNTIFFKNCTIVNNEASGGSGGGAALYYAEVDFVNCIAYNNTSPYDDDNVYIDGGGSTATVNYCNMPMPEYNTTGSNNIDTDPLFVDVANGDYHLQATSPCIDAGTDIGLPFAGTAPDMGCFETGNILTKEISNTKIDIYPNPTNDIIYFLGIDNINNCKIEITDISGKLLKNIILTNSYINISKLECGTYFVKILNDNKVYINKIIKK